MAVFLLASFSAERYFTLRSKPTPAVVIFPHNQNSLFFQDKLHMIGLLKPALVRHTGGKYPDALPVYLVFTNITFEISI